MVEIIAEVGVNHNGDMSIAQRLIDAAKWAGADMVKFQMFSSQKLWGDDRIKHLEFSRPIFRRLMDQCEEIGVEFLCTPFDIESMNWLVDQGMKRIKISSGLAFPSPFYDAALATGLPMIVSTGMHSHNDICRILSKNTKLLHCTSTYPAPLEDVNLEVLAYCPWAYGYSDHTEGIHVAIAAVALGAQMIEKHLTYDRKAPGPDHKASIEPAQFKEMVKCIRDIELALGDSNKRVMPSEEHLRKVWRDKQSDSIRGNSSSGRLQEDSA